MPFWPASIRDDFHQVPGEAIANATAKHDQECGQRLHGLVHIEARSEQGRAEEQPDQVVRGSRLLECESSRAEFKSASRPLAQ